MEKKRRRRKKFNFDFFHQVEFLDKKWTNCAVCRPTCAPCLLCGFNQKIPLISKKSAHFSLLRELLQLLYMKRKRGPRSLRHYSLSMSKQITSHYGFPIIRKVVILTKQTVFQFWRENSNLVSLKKIFNEIFLCSFKHCVSIHLMYWIHTLRLYSSLQLWRFFEMRFCKFSAQQQQLCDDGIHRKLSGNCNIFAHSIATFASSRSASS